MPSLDFAKVIKIFNLINKETWNTECLAYALLNVCEEVCAHNQDVDHLIGGMKKQYF